MGRLKKKGNPSGDGKVVLSVREKAHRSTTKGRKDLRKVPRRKHLGKTCRERKLARSHFGQIRENDGGVWGRGKETDPRKNGSGNSNQESAVTMGVNERGSGIV